MAKKEATKRQSDEATKGADTTDTAQNPPPHVPIEEVKVDPLPACPKGMYRLRSRYRTYRFAGVQFDNHVAIVDEATFQKAKRSPQFGQDARQGGHFWLDTNQT